MEGDNTENEHLSGSANGKRPADDDDGPYTHHHPTPSSSPHTPHSPLLCRLLCGQ